MTVRRSTRRPWSRNVRNCKTNCRNGLKRRGRSWKASRNNNRQNIEVQKRRAKSAPFSFSQLVHVPIACAITAALVSIEAFFELGVAQWLARVVGQKVLLGDIGDVFALRIHGEQVIKRLVFRRPDLLRNRQPPFLSV